MTAEPARNPPATGMMRRPFVDDDQPRVVIADLGPDGSDHVPAPRPDAAFGRRDLLRGGVAAGVATGLGLVAAGCASTSAATPTSAPMPAPVSGPAAPAIPPVRFGLNYTPSKHWWYVWQNWDPARISDDLAQIAALGMDHVRAQLMWDVFQPAPDVVDGRMLDRLSELLDLAAQHSLDVDVSVLTGFLSGHQYIPVWARGQNWVIRPELVDAQVRLFQALGERVGAHPRLMGFDLGNELLGRAPCRDLTQLGLWLSTLLAAARAGAPQGLNTVSGTGLFTPPYPTLLATMGDVSVIHPWYFLSGSVTDGRLRDEPLHHVEYNIEYMKAFHPFAPHAGVRQVWVQEMGAPPVNFLGSVSVPEALAPEFATASYANALTCQDLYAITWWDSHDIDTASVPVAFHAPEPILGLFDVRGVEKPVGYAIAEVIRRYRAGELALPAHRDTAVVGDDRATFAALYGQGVRAAVVAPGLATNRSYLDRRGISRVTA